MPLLTLEQCKAAKPLGSQVFVRRYRPPVKMTPDSLIVLPRDFMEFRLPGVGMTSWHDNPRLEVLAVGPGELLESGERESMEGLSPGDILIADSLVTDERNRIGVGDDDTDGIYAVHIKIFETLVVEKGPVAPTRYED